MLIDYRDTCAVGATFDSPFHPRSCVKIIQCEHLALTNVKKISHFRNGLKMKISRLEGTCSHGEVEKSGSAGDTGAIPPLEYSVECVNSKVDGSPGAKPAQATGTTRDMIAALIKQESLDVCVTTSTSTRT